MPSFSAPARDRTQPSSSFHYEMGNEFAVFLNNPHLHDLLICCQQQTFYAHQDILRSRSLPLDMMFRSESFAQRLNMHGVALIELDQHPDVVLNILRYIYTGDFCEPDIYHVLDFARMARSLQLPLLEARLRRQFGSLVEEPAQERDDRVEEDDHAAEGVVFPREGGEEGANGPSLSYVDTSVSRLRRHSRMSFMNASRLEGRVEVHVGQYCFRRQSAVVLAARSTYFATHINSVDSSVDVTGVPVEHVALVLRFLRAESEEQIPDLDTALKVLHSSTCLGVPSLIAFCEHLLHTRFLGVGTVCRIWNSVQGSEFVFNLCLKFVQEHFLEVAAHPSFLNLQHRLVKSALSSGRISASVADMMNALRRWAVAYTSGRRSNQSGVAETDPAKQVDELLLTLLPPKTMFNFVNRLTLLGASSAESAFIIT